MDVCNTIGNRIKSLRETKGYTQAQLAKELFVKRETINQWENGARDLKTEYTIKLADIFGVTCDYLLRGVRAENVDINKRLGLSDESIKTIENLNNTTEYKQYMTYLNSFINNSFFLKFLLEMKNYSEIRNRDDVWQETALREFIKQENIMIENDNFKKLGLQALNQQQLKDYKTFSRKRQRFLVFEDREYSLFRLQKNVVEITETLFDELPKKIFEDDPYLGAIEMFCGLTQEGGVDDGKHNE